MSLLYRNGTGRNNIAWGGGTTTAGNYLRRTGTGRNNISFLNISSNGTHNILNRTASGRNNIKWQNTTFTFKTQQQINVEEMFKQIVGKMCYVKATSGPSGLQESDQCYLRDSGSYYYFEKSGTTRTVITNATAYMAWEVYCTNSSGVNSLKSYMNKFSNNQSYYVNTYYYYYQNNTTKYTTNNLYFSGYSSSSSHNNCVRLYMDKVGHDGLMTNHIIDYNTKFYYK